MRNLKKLLALILATMMCLGLAACGNGDETDGEPAENGEPAESGGIIHITPDQLPTKEPDEPVTQPVIDDPVDERANVEDPARWLLDKYGEGMHTAYEAVLSAVNNLKNGGTDINSLVEACRFYNENLDAAVDDAEYFDYPISGVGFGTTRFLGDDGYFPESDFGIATALPVIVEKHPEADVIGIMFPYANEIKDRDYGDWFMIAACDADTGTMYVYKNGADDVCTVDVPSMIGMDAPAGFDDSSPWRIGICTERNGDGTFVDVSGDVGVLDSDQEVIYHSSLAWWLDTSDWNMYSIIAKIFMEGEK